MIDAVEGFSSMFRNAIGHRLAAGAESMNDMFADDVVVEFPFAPPSAPKSLAGKAVVADYVKDLAGQFAFDRFGEPTIQFTTDPDLVVAEFKAVGRSSTTGEIYNQRYICFIRAKDGKIVHYREYWNPLVVLRALHGSAAIDAVIAGQA